MCELSESCCYWSSFQNNCSGCKAVRYCGHKCQKHHWCSHKGLCQAIQQLEAQRTSEVVNGDGYVFTSHLTPKQQITGAKLVGKISVWCRVL